VLVFDMMLLDIRYRSCQLITGRLRKTHGENMIID
jgi:hypothetical protein